LRLIRLQSPTRAVSPEESRSLGQLICPVLLLEDRVLRRLEFPPLDHLRLGLLWLRRPGPYFTLRPRDSSRTKRQYQHRPRLDSRLRRGHGAFDSRRYGGYYEKSHFSDIWNLNARRSTLGDTASNTTASLWLSMRVVSSSSSSSGSDNRYSWNIGIGIGR
jgi:hypothetical protein